MISVEECSEEDSLTGSLGVVCFLDDETRTKATGLSKQVCSRPLDWRLTTPHISLYHAYLDGLELSYVKNILDRISSLRSFPLELSSVEVFGEKFIFWNMANKSAAEEMHKLALTLSRYVDNTVIQRAAKEALNLSSIQMANLRNYGYPLVKSEFLPHITLGYIESGIEQDELVLENYDHEASIEKVKLARIGEYGSVSTIIDIC